MICTEGQPSLACQKLLVGCNEKALKLRYHGDFDWGGIRIANYVNRITPGIKPWRYRASDYETFANGCQLKGSPVDASWDATLRRAMEAGGQAYHEEQLLPVLLADLRGHASR